MGDLESNGGHVEVETLTMAIGPMWRMEDGVGIAVGLVGKNMVRDGNGAGFFGYPPCPAPNGTGFKFNKQV